MVSITGDRLSPRHLHELREGSAITDPQIAARGYETIDNPRGLPAPFTGDQRRPGLLIPIRDRYGDIVLYQHKPNEPRIDKRGRAVKYETPAGSTPRLDIPAAAMPYLDDPAADLWITEGCKKVDSAVCHGIPCIIGLLGVDMWRHDRGRALGDWAEIALNGRIVVVAFDSDVMTKAGPRRAIAGLANYLDSRGSRVRYCLIPAREGQP